MGGEVRGSAVLLDAMGTLLHLEDPVPRLRAALRERFGADVGADVAKAAMRAEIAYYRAHMRDGRDAASVAALRARCAEAMRPALPGALASAPGAALTEALMAALEFSAYPDAAPALRALRAGGARLVVVSNWDAALAERLAETGLLELVDGVVTSAAAGAAKPARAIFERGLELAGAGPADAWHVGDEVGADVAGARASGLRAVLVARAGPPPDAGGAHVLATLAALPTLVGAGAPYPSRS
jgi:putative hydrolase of the HAD superfamily